MIQKLVLLVFFFFWCAPYSKIIRYISKRHYNNVVFERPDGVPALETHWAWLIIYCREVNSCSEAVVVNVGTPRDPVSTDESLPFSTIVCVRVASRKVLECSLILWKMTKETLSPCFSRHHV